MLKPDFSNRLDGTFNPHFSNTYVLKHSFHTCLKEAFFYTTWMYYENSKVAEVQPQQGKQKFKAI